jgi:MurNAc alpha-1-phosphate uridylyltransferase
VPDLTEDPDLVGGPARPGDRIAGIALAAGAGTRLRPLTGLRPKALCPVGGRPLVDLALDRLAPVAGDGPGRLAVNAHHHADVLRRHCAGRATVSVEEPEALGTAGGVAALRHWLDGRDALVTNADAYLPGPPDLARGWDGVRMRLLCVPLPATARPDFTTPDGRGVRYVGACLLPWAAVRTLRAEPAGLYEVLWREAGARGELDLVVAEDLVAIDCGTPADYLAANLHASGGAPVVGEGAVVLGHLERCVVWDGAYVGPDESLRDTVRAGTREQPVTVALGRA